MKYTIRITKEAYKDIKKLPPKQQQKLKQILTEQVAIEPLTGKKLIGDLAGLYSIRLNYKDRIIYSIDRKHKIVYLHRAKRHYDD